MSGFLPDIAGWALGGGAAGQGGEAGNNDDNNNGNNEPAGPAISEDEMRAKRMARLAALEKKNSAASGDNEGGASSMDVDTPSTAPEPMEVDEVKPAASPPSISSKSTPANKDVTMEPAPKKKMKAPSAAAAPADPLAKLRRKKVLLLRKVLLVTVGDATSDRTPSCVHLTLDDDDIYNTTKSPNGVQVRHVAELLAARLSLHPSSRSLETMPSQVKLGLIGYLGGCHKRAGEELKDLRSKNGEKKKKDDSFEELCGIVEEIRNQVRTI